MPTRPTVRSLAAVAIVGTVVGIWAYQTLSEGLAPDTMLALIVFLSAIVSLVHLFGRGTVKAGVEVLEQLRGGD